MNHSSTHSPVTSRTPGNTPLGSSVSGNPASKASPSSGNHPYPGNLSALSEALSVASAGILPSVREAHAESPLSAEAAQCVRASRANIESILVGKDPRLLVIAGPCSLHDLGAATEFAERFAALQQEVASTTLLVMRGMFEKPRSTVGWKGFVHQSNVLGGHDMPKAITELRKFFSRCGELGVAIASEALDPALQLYFIDTVSYITIGARTSESQIHRQMASSLRLPVGFKNPTSGSLKVAVDSVQAAASSQSTVFSDPDGKQLQIVTNGNPLAHIILRGSGTKTNYHPADIAAAQTELSERSRIVGLGLLEALVVDCSHGNSSGDYLRQPVVFQQCVDELCRPDAQRPRALRGLMLEANLMPGKQLLKSEPPAPDVSVTDACIGFDTLRSTVLSAHERFERRGNAQ